MFRCRFSFATKQPLSKRAAELSLASGKQRKLKLYREL
jgi:hypothetical protein